MASRNFKRVQALQSEIKFVHAKVNIGASGAPTLVTANGASAGVTSVTRNSAGLYTLVLDDRYMALVHADVKQQIAAAQDIVIQMVSETVSASTKNVVFRCQAAAVATDPSSGSVLYIKLELKNTDAK